MRPRPPLRGLAGACPSSLDPFGDPLGDGDHREVGVRPRDRRHHRRVRDDEPVEAEHAAARVDDRADRARADRVEEAARARADVRLGVDSGAGAPLADSRSRSAARVVRGRGDPRTPSTSGATSRSSERKPCSTASGVRGSGPLSRTRPRERGFIRKTAALTSQPGSAAGKKKTSPARRSRDLRHEHRVLGRERVHLRGEALARLPADARRRRGRRALRRPAGRARGPGRCRCGAGSPASRTRPRRARSCPRGTARGRCRRRRARRGRRACRRGSSGSAGRAPRRGRRTRCSSARCRRGSRDGRSRPRRTPRRRRDATATARPAGTAARRSFSLGAAQVRLELGVAPAVAPLVVVGRRARDHGAGVVRRAAAEHTRPQLRAVVAVGLPGVRERERAAVEQVVRPPATRRTARSPGPASIRQTVRSAVLAQPRREHAPGRTAARHDDVESPHQRIISRCARLASDDVRLGDSGTGRRLQSCLSP